MDCEILDAIQSPLMNGYRTKCEFTIGKNLEGVKTVGFLLGLYRDGVTAVLGPDECLHIPEKAKQVAKAMEVFFCRDCIMDCQNLTIWCRTMYITLNTMCMIEWKK